MFSRPVDPTFVISRYYGERDRKYEWSMDQDNGLWLPVKLTDGQGQHRGTDFDCPRGTIVRAMCDGMIVRVRHENTIDFKEGMGLYILQLVLLPGYDSWALRYTHLKAAYATPGQKVCRHDAIAESGDVMHVDLMDLKAQWRPIPIETE